MKDLNCVIEFKRNDRKIFSIRCNEKTFNNLNILVNSYICECSKL